MPLQLFWQKWPAAEEPLKRWYRDTRKATWDNFADVKQTFGPTDQAKVASGDTVVIFDIGGNKFRLIAHVSYPKKKVYVLLILSHKEYDKNVWKRQL